jgi:hypothetical protein
MPLCSADKTIQPCARGKPVIDDAATQKTIASFDAPTAGEVKQKFNDYKSKIPAPPADISELQRAIGKDAATRLECIEQYLVQAKSGAKSSSGTNRYGALALIAGRGQAYGWAVDLPTQSAANELALKECNGSNPGNCKVVMEFKNACASYAIDNNKSTAQGWAWAADKAWTDSEATKLCNARGGSGSSCFVKVWGCTTR